MSELRLQVNSEIGRLRSIFLHKPQAELHNMVPANMTRLLFDDLPDAQMAGEEYDSYLDVLRQNGVEIHFIEDLVAEAIDAAGVKEEFLRDFFAVHHLDDQEQIQVLVDYFSDYEQTVDMVSKLIAGLRKEELPEYTKLFHALNGEDDFFILDPLPNTYFTRDPLLSRR
jgi:arginine deiminase